MFQSHTVIPVNKRSPLLSHLDGILLGKRPRKFMVVHSFVASSWSVLSKSFVPILSLWFSVLLWFKSFLFVYVIIFDEMLKYSFSVVHSFLFCLKRSIDI